MSAPGSRFSLATFSLLERSLLSAGASPAAFPAGVDNIRSHLCGITFLFAFLQRNNTNSSDGFDGASNRNPSVKTPQKKANSFFLPTGHKCDFTSVYAYRLANQQVFFEGDELGAHGKRSVFLISQSFSYVRERS